VAFGFLLVVEEGSVVLTIEGLSKVYKDGLHALSNINLEVHSKEIFALLGPNGAGKTTLIKTVCGISNPSSGVIKVGGFDVVKDSMQTRSLIGLVPQELSIDMWATVWAAVRFSRGLFGKAPDDAYLEQLLKKLSLWDKRSNKILTLSGGMKRRLLIAKALAHEPKVLFLDEPSAGVDVELRLGMWKQVRELRDAGVTIILTTHYIEEAEEIADRIGIINKGRLILVEDKDALMRKLGTKQIAIELTEPISAVPAGLARFKLAHKGAQLVYGYNSGQHDNGVSALIEQITKEGLSVRDIRTSESSLEEIFVSLVNAA
jgi:ABC-2 type transport system ATP-binding protein